MIYKQFFIDKALKVLYNINVKIRKEDVYMDYYVYGPGAWCGEELDDYAFEIYNMRVSTTYPTKEELTNIMRKFWQAEANEVFEIVEEDLGGAYDTYTFACFPNGCDVEMVLLVRKVQM